MKAYLGRPDRLGQHVILHPHVLQVLVAGNAEDVHDAGQLVPGVLALQHGSEDDQLGQDTAQTPHVHLCPVLLGTKQQLRGPVKPDKNQANFLSLIITVCTV